MTGDTLIDTLLSSYPGARPSPGELPPPYETVEIRQRDQPDTAWIQAVWCPAMFGWSTKDGVPRPPFDYEWRYCQDDRDASGALVKEYRDKHPDLPAFWRDLPERPPTPTTPPESTKSPRRQILEEAADTVDGPRNESYGGPEDSFKVIANLWAAYLEAIKYAHRGDYELATHDVAAMMALLKIARVAGSNGDHWDSWVDLAGYAACGAECSGAKPWNEPVAPE